MSINVMKIPSGKRPLRICVSILAIVATMLLTIIAAAPTQRASAATVAVAVSNPSLTGTTPVKVGDSLTFTADLANVTGNAGDSFTITLPSELDFAGAVTFPILGGYGQCSWSGKTATCTLTKAAVNASGGISLWLKAVGTHSGGSNITIGTTTVHPTVPGGSIGSGTPSTGWAGSPVFNNPYKMGSWNSNLTTNDGTVIAQWSVYIPAYSVATKVTINDALVSGNGYVNQHYYWNSSYPAWAIDHFAVTGSTWGGTPQGDVYWYSAGVPPTNPPASYGGTNTVDDAVLNAESKQFQLTFTAQPGKVYRLTYYTALDDPSQVHDGDLLKNNVTINNYQTDDVVVVRTGSAWLKEDYSRFSIKKIVSGDQASSVPIGTNFTIQYTAGSLSGSLTVPYNMTSVTSPWVPVGTTFTIKEINLPAISGVTWGDWTITGPGVTKNPDGTYAVTPGAGQTIALTLNNAANSNTPPPVPSITIVKKDVDGNDADTAATAADLTANGGSTGLVFTITNNGQDDLKNVTVSDSVTAGSATVSNVSCDFSKLGGPSTGTSWSGPFKIGDSFGCTAQLSGVAAGDSHTDVATVTGTGILSNVGVSGNNPYHASVQAKGSVTWHKVADDASSHQGIPTPLGGSRWTLTGSGIPAGTVVSDCVSSPCPVGSYLDQDPTPGGFTLTGLNRQSYALVEHTAPVGYLLDATPHTFTISTTTLNFVFNNPFVNKQQNVPVLPLTGGLGADGFWLSGAGLFAIAFIAAGVFLYRRRS